MRLARNSHGMESRYVSATILRFASHRQRGRARKHTSMRCLAVPSAYIVIVLPGTGGSGTTLRLLISRASSTSPVWELQVDQH